MRKGAEHRSIFTWLLWCFVDHRGREFMEIICKMAASKIRESQSLTELSLELVVVQAPVLTSHPGTPPMLTTEIVIIRRAGSVGSGLHLSIPTVE